MPDFDAIIIGTGQAGPSLAFRLAGAGMKVAVVERHLVGGTCVNTGCTPTKALVASAYAARIARRAAEYGVVIGGDIGIDMRRVKARTDAIVAASRNGLTSALENAANITLYRGHARFASPQAVEIAGERMRAGRIFINVGGRALVPPMPGINEVPYLTNSSMMDVDFLPHHLIIVGGSYIGLEFGQMYRRFGSEVTIIEMAPRLVRHEDEDVSAAIKDIIELEGVDVRLNAECISLAKRGDEIIAKVDCTAGAAEVAGSHLLLAVGRRPNTDDLDLDKAGVRCDERGYIVVDDRLQTTAPGVWALGDCNGKGAFTHTAYNDFEIVAANLLDRDPRRVSERITAYDQVLTQDKIAGIRHALVTFVTATAIRRHQQKAAGEQQKRYAMIVHVETSRTAHAWQSTVVSELIDALQEAIKLEDPIFYTLVDSAIKDLSRSLKAEGLLLPSRDTIAAEVLDYVKKGAVATEKVNSDNDVQKLLDDNAELKLRTPCNVFIGGQILDRGITVPNLIGFYYGRSPKRMQQDTVLQHARMYGDHARPDLAVTRFYATAHNYLALRSIHEFDTALRHAFEKGAHNRGVAFVLKDQTNRVIPCAPNKILVSDIVALRPGSAYLPVGFRTKSRTTMVPIMQKLDRLIPVGKLEAGTISEITSDNAIEIIDLIERCFDFEPGYGFDWEACRAAIEYFSKIAPPPEERGECLIVGGTGRKLSWQRPGGRFSDAPHTMQDRATIRRIIGHKPILVLSRQDGREEDGWRGTPFWWPVLFAPAKAAPSVFASSTRDAVLDEDDPDD